MIRDIDESSGYMYSWELIGWGLANLRIRKPKEALTEDEIREVIRWVGICSVDTIFVGEIVEAHANKEVFTNKYDLEKARMIFHLGGNDFATLEPKAFTPKL